MIALIVLLIEAVAPKLLGQGVSRARRMMVAVFAAAAAFVVKELP
jgi:hypothetical protein